MLRVSQTGGARHAIEQFTKSATAPEWYGSKSSDVHDAAHGAASVVNAHLTVDGTLRAALDKTEDVG
jgi:hypothetical protein